MAGAIILAACLVAWPLISIADSLKAIAALLKSQDQNNV